MSNTEMVSGNRSGATFETVYAWNTAVSISCGWWIPISIVVLLCNGLLFSLAGLIVLIPGEIAGVLTAAGLMVVFGPLMTATSNAKLSNAYAILFGLFMLSVMAGDVVTSIYLTRFVSIWLYHPHP